MHFHGPLVHHLCRKWLREPFLLSRMQHRETVQEFPTVLPNTHAGPIFLGPTSNHELVTLFNDFLSRRTDT